MRAAICLALAGIAVSGCSMFTEYQAVKAVAKEGVVTAIEDRKEFNDVKAEVLLQLPCSASLGSVFRITDTRKQAILIELCGGPPADSQMTVEDMAAMMRIMRP